MPIIAVADRSSVPAGVLQAPADPSEIIDAVGRVPRDQPVLLVADGRPGLLAARSARLALDQERIGLLAHDVPATLYFLTAAALRLLPEDSLSLAGCATALLSRSTATRVLLSSVTALVRPAPSVVDHARSLWPPSRFLVDWQQGTVTSARTLVAPDGHLAVVSRSAKGWADLDETGWAPERVELPPAEAPHRWRSSRWLEVTTLQAPLESVVSAVTDVTNLRDFPRCPSCGRTGWAGHCLFCQLPFDEALPDAADLIPTATVGGHE